MANRMACMSMEDYNLLCKVVFGTHDILDALSVTQDGLNRKEEELFIDTISAIQKINNFNSKIKE